MHAKSNPCIRKRIQQLEERQAELRGILKKRSHETGNELLAIDCKTPEDFCQSWAALSGDVEQQYQEKRKKGWRKVARRAEDFAVDGEAFLKDFSPIVDLVQNTAAPYGGLAIGTLSFLFTVRVSS